jgi:hypothetical protein
MKRTGHRTLLAGSLICAAACGGGRGVSASPANSGPGHATVSRDSFLCSAGHWCWQNPLPQGNPLYGAWLSSPTDGWAVGSAGTMLRWNGTRWSTYATPNAQAVLAMWMSSAADGWAVGLGGAIERWSGGVWSAVTSGTTNDLVAVWGTSSDDVWAVGAGWITHWDGHAWAGTETGTALLLRGVWSDTAGDAWVVGDAGPGFDESGRPVSYTGTILHLQEGRWTNVHHPVVGDLTGIWGSGVDVWAVGRAGTILRWDGQSWSKLNAEVTADLFGIRGSGTNDIWAVGSAGVILHWDGISWSTVASASGVHSGFAGVAVCSPTSAIAVGAGGNIEHWDGASWRTDSTGLTIDLTGVWGSSDHDVWAVGAAGSILHWDGSRWSDESPATSEDFQAVWGTGPDDVTAAGSLVAAHWDGTTWSIANTVATPPTTTPTEWAAAPNDRWKVGTGGSIQHFDGYSWSRISAGTKNDLLAVWGSDAYNVWAVGQAGVILRYIP